MRRETIKNAIVSVVLGAETAVLAYQVVPEIGTTLITGLLMIAAGMFFLTAADNDETGKARRSGKSASPRW